MSFLRGLYNTRQDAGEVVLYIVVGEPQYPHPVLCQIFGACGIIGRLAGFCVDAAVQLDFELMLDTEGVEDKRPERMLAAKLETGQTTAS